jgi:hypothetical protein
VRLKLGLGLALFSRITLIFLCERDLFCARYLFVSRETASTFSEKSYRLVLSDHGDGARDRVSSHAHGSATREEGAYGLGRSSSDPKGMIFPLPPYRSSRSTFFSLMYVSFFC